MLATNIYKEISIINGLKLVQIHFFQDSNSRLLFKKSKCETVAKNVRVRYRRKGRAISPASCFRSWISCPVVDHGVASLLVALGEAAVREEGGGFAKGQVLDSVIGGAMVHD